jgi:hypothetical protein
MEHPTPTSVDNCRRTPSRLRAHSWRSRIPCPPGGPCLNDVGRTLHWQRSPRFVPMWVAAVTSVDAQESSSMGALKETILPLNLLCRLTSSPSAEGQRCGANPSGVRTGSRSCGAGGRGRRLAGSGLSGRCGTGCGVHSPFSFRALRNQSASRSRSSGNTPARGIEDSTARAPCSPTSGHRLERPVPAALRIGQGEQFRVRAALRPCNQASAPPNLNREGGYRPMSP